MNREELIERARRAGFGCKCAPCMGILADFCLPLLAAERERAIEEARQMCRDHATASRRWINDNQDKPRDDRMLRVAYEAQALTIAAELSALARANEKEQPPAAARASLARTEGDAVKSEESSAVPRAADRNTGDGSNPSAGGHSPTQRQRAEELLRLHACDTEIEDRHAVVTTMLAYGAEREERAYLREDARQLRARSAPPEVDVFEAVAREWYSVSRLGGFGGPSLEDNLAALLRDRFGPLAEALERIASIGETWGTGAWAKGQAKEALNAFRA